MGSAGSDAGARVSQLRSPVSLDEAVHLGVVPPPQQFEGVATAVCAEQLDRSDDLDGANAGKHVIGDVPISLAPDRKPVHRRLLANLLYPLDAVVVALPGHVLCGLCPVIGAREKRL